MQGWGCTNILVFPSVLVLGSISWPSPGPCVTPGATFSMLVSLTNPVLDLGFGIRNWLWLLPQAACPGTDFTLMGQRSFTTPLDLPSDKISSFSSRICNFSTNLLVASYNHFCFWISNGTSGGNTTQITGLPPFLNLALFHFADTAFFTV